MLDSFNLQRFLDGQSRVEKAVTRELQRGRKETHWMWFVFPQIHGLGHSPTAQFYAISSVEEAEAFLAHPILGERLRAWTRMVLEIKNRSAEQIFGYPDYLKFRSCMTLFDAASRRSAASDKESVFGMALDRYYDGRPDEATQRIIG